MRGKVEYMVDDAGVVERDPPITPCGPACGNSTGVDMRLDEPTELAVEAVVVDVVAGKGMGFVLCLAPSRREREANGAAKRLAVLPEREGALRGGRG